MKLFELNPTNFISNETILPEILENTLVESRGLAARDRGEVFKSKTDDSVIYFRTIKFWPEEGGKMDPASLQPTIDEVQKTMKNVPIAWVNKPTSKTGGFSVALFDDEDENIVAFGRYFNEIKPNLISNKWDAMKDLPGYAYSSNAAAKAASGMMPQDIFEGKNAIDLTAPEIVDVILARFGENHPLTILSQRIAAGEPLPITLDGSGMNFTAFRDYFCEILHPIALQMGTYSGNAADAAAIYLGPGGFEDCLISFGKTKTEGLSDSVMIDSSGRKIKVSSKGGAKGADASVKNLVNAAEELANLGNPKLLEKNKTILDLIRDIGRAGMHGAPLMLAQRYNLITLKDVKDIHALRDKAATTLQQLISNTTLSATLRKLARERVTRDPNNLNAYCHLVAAIAHEVADHVNSEGNFSASASEILNNSGLVQVYTSAKQVGNEWTLLDFNTKFPGAQVTQVLLKAGKNYSSTDIKGNFGFRILRDGAKDSDPEDDGTTATGTFQ